MHSNARGITAGAVLSVAGNRVYNNSEAGILAGHDASIVGNFVYSNSLGIWGRAIWYSGYAYFSGQIVNNVVYSNTNGGLLVQTAYGRVRASSTIRSTNPSATPSAWKGIGWTWSTTWSGF